MKTKIIIMVMAASVLLVGCGKKAASSTVVTTTADSVAVTKFLETDWSARPIFPPGSVLNWSEDQFNALSDAENNVKSTELISQLASLKEVARAVAQAGEDAAAKGDTAQARKCFTALEQCGAAMNTTNSGHLVQLVGQAFQKRAMSELAKIGQ